MESKKCDVLVVDTAGFIKSAPLEEIGDQVGIRKTEYALRWLSMFIRQIFFPRL